jgi:hypothetical protein
MKSLICRGILALTILLCVFGWHAQAARAAGTWAPCTINPFDFNTGLYLLSDGSVLVHGDDFYNNTEHWDTWYRLTPDNTGSYANGAWTQAAISPWGALYTPTMLLSDGRFWFAGGEYTTNSDANAQQHVLIYDPMAYSWTAGRDAPLEIADTGASMLKNGTIFVGTDSFFTTQTQIYNPSTDSWTLAGGELDGNGDEAGWQLLQDGSVFDCYFSAPGFESQRYLPSLDEWVPAADSPITISTGGEEGPVVYLENGQIFCISDNGPTALYTPPNTLMGLGSWTVGPTIPNGDIGADTPAALEPNGKVILIGSQGLFGAADFYEYDPNANTYVSLPSPLSYQPNPSYACSFLDLPNGQILFTDSSQSLEVYTPDSAPQDDWRPTVSNVSGNPDGSFTLTGTQLNGRSYGASYGDDYMPSTDFPLVYLTDQSGHLYYCRTFNYSTRAIWTGNASQTCQFTVPSQVPLGNYSLFVSVNGISSSAGFSFQVTAQNITPTILSLNPSSATQDGPGFTMTVNGSGFVLGSNVTWNGVDIVTTFISSNVLKATVPAGDLTNVVPVSVGVTNPGGAQSNTLLFTINPKTIPPSATITNLAPSSAIVGSGSFTLTVTGSGIVSGATVDWNGAPLASTFDSATQITATVPASDISAVIPVQVTVVNPGGANPSNALPFTINPKPIIPPATLTSLAPNSAEVGAPGFTLTVTGTNFVAGSTVQWNGVDLPTTFGKSTQETALVPASDLAAVVPVNITVVNGPGVAPSNSLPFTIGPHVFNAGLQLFSVPNDYSGDSLTSVLGYPNPTLAVWLPASLQYAITPSPPADALRLGQGYWARFPQNASLTFAGVPAPLTRPYSITLKKGWNMIGDPFPVAVDMGSLIILDNQGTQHPFQTAVQSDLVGPNLYSYPPGSANYVSQSSGPIEPYSGYWILTSQDCTLLVPVPVNL